MLAIQAPALEAWFGELVRRILFIGFFLFVLQVGPEFARAVVDSLFQIGADGGSPGRPASDLADELTRGVPPGIIGEPARPTPSVVAPQVDEDGQPVITNPFQPQPASPARPQVQQIQTRQQPQETEAEWRLRLQREFEEARLREQHRQDMAALQARPTAANSPMSINLANIEGVQGQAGQQGVTASGGSNLLGGGGAPGVQDLYATAMQAGLAGQGAGRADANNQAGKEAFFNQEINDLGYLPNLVVPQLSPYELKRGSVIPATLITGRASHAPSSSAVAASRMPISGDRPVPTANPSAMPTITCAHSLLRIHACSLKRCWYRWIGCGSCASLVPPGAAI